LSKKKEREGKFLKDVVALYWRCGSGGAEPWVQTKQTNK
jgi:hypothetical protein